MVMNESVRIDSTASKIVTRAVSSGIWRGVALVCDGSQPGQLWPLPDDGKTFATRKAAAAHARQRLKAFLKAMGPKPST
jgi:hypothetical protein